MKRGPRKLLRLLCIVAFDILWLLAIISCVAARVDAQDAQAKRHNVLPVDEASNLPTRGSDLPKTALERSGSEQPAMNFLLDGVELRNKGQLSAAIRVFQTGVKHYPDHRNLGLELAITLAWQHHFRAALRIYDRFLARMPKDPELLLAKARVLFWMGASEQAMDCYRFVLRYAKTSLLRSEAWLGIARIHQSRLDRVRSQSIYRRILGLDPGRKDAIHGLREAADIKLWRLRLAPSVAVDAGSREPIYGVHLETELRIHPQLAIAASYLLRAAQPVLVGRKAEQAESISTSLQQDIEVRGSLRFAERNTFDFGYGLRLLSNRETHLFPLRISHQFLANKQLVAMLGLRPGYGRSGGYEFLAEGALQYVFSERVWAMAQYFAYANTVGARNHSGLITADVLWNPRFASRTSAGVSFIEGQATLLIAATLRIPLQSAFAVHLQYEHLYGFVHRHTLTLALEARA